MIKSSRYLKPQYHALPQVDSSLLLRTGVLLSLMAAIGFWGVFNAQFFVSPMLAPFSASLGLLFFLAIGLRYWPLFFLLQASLLIIQGGAWPAVVALLAASYLDFSLITRALNQVYQQPDISQITPQKIFSLLAPCALSFAAVLVAVWWANPLDGQLSTVTNSAPLVGILFLLGLLERALSFGLLFSYFQHTQWRADLLRIIALSIGMALYTYFLRTWLGYSATWIYTLFLIFPAFIIPFIWPLWHSSWASLAGVMGMLLAILTQPIESVHSSLLNYNIIAVLLLTTLIQNGFAILRASFDTLRRQEQQTNQRIRQVLNIAPILACSYDRTGRFHFWNEGCENSLGWSHEELNTQPELFKTLFPTSKALSRYAFPASYQKDFMVWNPLNKDGQPQQILWGSFPISEHRFMGIGIDLSQQIQAKLKIERTRQHYIEILKKIPIGIFTIRQSASHRYQFDFVTPYFAEIVGLPVHVILDNPHTVFNLWLQDENKESLLAAKQAFEDGEGFCLVNRLNIQGQARWLKVDFNVSTLDTGERVANGALIDITEEREQTRRLSIAAMVLREMQEGLLILDAQLTIIHCNPMIYNLTGYRQEELINRPVQSLFTQQDRLAANSKIWQRVKQSESWYGEITFYTKDHSKKHLQVFLSRVNIPFEQPEQFIVMLSDITPFKTREEKLIQMANFDLLTGLATRRLLYDRLNQAIAYTARNKQILAVCYLDLNDFKQINDQFGHKAGDQLLTEFSSRLRQALRQSDTAARMGGDEVVILLPNLSTREGAQIVLQGLTDCLTQPYKVLNRYEVQVSASIGVNFFDARDYSLDDPLPTASKLIQQADQAMYLAKFDGNNTIHYYS